MSRAATGSKRIYLERDLEAVDEKIAYLKAELGEHLFMLHYTCSVSRQLSACMLVRFVIHL